MKLLLKWSAKYDSDSAAWAAAGSVDTDLSFVDLRHKPVQVSAASQAELTPRSWTNFRGFMKKYKTEFKLEVVQQIEPRSAQSSGTLETVQGPGLLHS